MKVEYDGEREDTRGNDGEKRKTATGIRQEKVKINEKNSLREETLST